MEIYRGGIIDKTKMYEADSRTGWHDFSIWVLYFNLVLGRLRHFARLGFFKGMICDESYCVYFAI